MALKHMVYAALVAAAAGAAAPASAAARPEPFYKGAIATDAQTGAVLFEENADAVTPPASMTKLMTFAVLFDQLMKRTIEMDTPVTVTSEDARVGMMKDSTAVWLRQGEVFTVEELIYAMMIQSANDAAYALAHKVGGTVPAFVAMMNAKARELGMFHSTFRTPNGFPPPSRRIADGDLTTPRDFAVLCRYLLLHTNILKYTSVKTRAFGAGVRLQPVQMTNHNHLLGKIAGVDGLKTGFTSGAGFCLSATAQRDGRRIIVVMMDSPDQRTRDLNVQELITQAFASLPLGGKPFEPVQDALPNPTRPTPAPTAASPMPANGPMIVYPGAGGR
jgi:D-alanyl-D-alanine carboxypeptidase (penicillin-binding protein 5/6)